MSRRLTLLFLFTAALMAVFGLRVAMSGSAHALALETTTGALTADPPSEPSPRVAALTPHATPEATVAVDAGSAGMLAVSNSMRSGREFYLYAMQHPDAGGVFYAKRLLLFCSGIRADDGTAEDDAAAAPRDADGRFWQLRDRASTQLRQKCADFTADELDAEERAAGAAPRDRFEKTASDVRAARQSGDAAAQKTALTQAITLADPQVFDDLRIRLSMSGAGDPSTVYFDGAAWPITSDVINTAYFLLPCDLGLKCTIDADGALATQCNSGATCYADRFAYARGAMGPGQERYAQAAALASAMALAVRQGRVDAFLAPGS